jgi:hypothetical protein
MFERFNPEARGVVVRAVQEARRMGHGHVGTEHLLLGLIGAPGTTVSDALIGAGAFLLPAREKVLEALANRSPAAGGGGGAADLPYTDRAARALDRSGRLALRVGSEHVRCEHVLLSVLDVEGTAGQVLRGMGVDPETVRQAVLAGGSSPSTRQAQGAVGRSDDAAASLEPGAVGRGDDPAAAREPGAALDPAAAAREPGAALDPAAAAPAPAADLKPGAAPAPVASDNGGFRDGMDDVGPSCAGCGASLVTSIARATLPVTDGDPGENVSVYYCSACGTAVGVLGL